MMRMLKGSIYILVAAAVALALALMSLLHGYHRLSAETLVAELSFQQFAPFRYSVELATGDLCHHQRFDLYGDQWRVDAQFLKWKPWANLLGLESRYRLDRLEGRYSQIERQNSDDKLAHALVEPPIGSLQAIPLLNDSLRLLADASYGSSTYQAIDTARIYQVYKTPTGLITRSKPRALERDEDGVLTIEINRACPQV